MGSTHIEISVFGKVFNPAVSPLCVKHCRSWKKGYSVGDGGAGSRLIEKLDAIKIEAVQNI